MATATLECPLGCYATALLSSQELRYVCAVAVPVKRFGTHRRLDDRLLLYGGLFFIGHDFRAYVGNAAFVPVNVLMAGGVALVLVGLPGMFKAEANSVFGLVGMVLVFVTGLIFGVFLVCCRRSSSPIWTPWRRLQPRAVLRHPLGRSLSSAGSPRLSGSSC